MAGFLVRAELVHQPLQLGAIQGEDELVGIRKAELDAVGVVQRLAFDALAVDETPCRLPASSMNIRRPPRTIRACTREARLSRRIR